MKKVVVLILAILLNLNCFTLAEETPIVLMVGETIVFGSFEQDNNFENGAEPIEWLVLDVEDGKALLLSKYVLDCRRYNETDGPAVWKDSSIRQWLNGEFYSSSFTEEESAIILNTTIKNGLNEQPIEEKWDPISSEDTVDKVFLLSIREYYQFFLDASRNTTGTPYANKRGAKGVFWDSTATQLTRSSGKKPEEACYLYFSPSSGTLAEGIRPALWIDVSIDNAEQDFELFARAQKYERKGMFAEAAEIYEKLGDYRNSDTLGKSCRYEQGVGFLENEDYANATRVFQTLGDYKDSYKMTRECRYKYAEACYDSGEYELAAVLYDEEGQYLDSMEKLLQCYGKLGIPVHYFDNNNIQFIHTKTDSGYSTEGSSEIKNGDIHYEWELGQFIIDDFTQKEDADSDHPVFIKGFGNTVTLRFWLKQDIDRLNGDKNLAISDDKKTYDDELHRGKMDFGRGTLIIRHTDHQHKSIITPYTDYLLAKNASGADTKVILNEEGEYDVALDYEVQLGNVKVDTGDKFQNYSIRLKFTIRNGDSPVHLMDSLTKNELIERDVTPNGFSIALVNTNPLDIHVKCYTIHTETSGRLTFNQDFDRIARDKQVFTKEGIYIISFTDKQTNRSMERIVFVGDETLRDQYDTIHG